MTDIELEKHTLDAIDRARSGAKVEDGRVELKREWPEDLAKAARLLAAHCNASGSDWVLWIIGLSEDGTSRQGPDLEAGKWVSQLAKHFDQGAPLLLRDLKVVSRDDQVTALLFEATRRPYVWCVSGPNAATASAVTREVPWRSGASTASARREDLVRMLAPMASNPVIEVTGGTMNFLNPEGSPFQTKSIMGRIELYFVPTSRATVTLPFHQMSAVLTSPDDPDFLWHLSVGDAGTILAMNHLKGMVVETEREIILNGPGGTTLHFEGAGLSQVPEHIITLRMSLSYSLVGLSVIYQVVATYVQLGENRGTGLWTAVPPRGIR